MGICTIEMFLDLGPSKNKDESLVISLFFYRALNDQIVIEMIVSFLKGLIFGAL